MWDEEINKKIKDAADQYHPAYDDNAWDKMEQMLNEHLPQKRDRRRIIFILPLVLLLGGAIFFMVSSKEIIPFSQKTLSKATIEKSGHENQNSSEPIANLNSVKEDSKSIPDVKEKNNLSKEAPAYDNAGAKKTTGVYTHGVTGIVNKSGSPAAKNPVPYKQERQTVGKPASNDVNAKTNSSIKNSTADIETTQQPGKSSNEEIVLPAAADNDNPEEKANADITKDEKVAIQSKDKDVAKAESPKVDGNIKQKKPGKNFVHNFGIGLGAGPDISAVRLNNTGKVTIAYGAELNYSFTRRFTLRTGFYIAKKIYSVDDNEYHVPPGSTWNTYLESVDANCKVYEIPLMVSYNFSKTRNHNWFVSAGLSSYFMKRESYIYYYKNALGVSYNTPWTVKNKNKHYFSVLDISGGYEYSFNKRFSINAEPYVKLPLGGIGIGKIKLNSAGVLVTAVVKPF